MAIILLTDEEYQHIQGQMNDLLGKVPTASPRAATHFAAVAKLHSYFLAKEDGKRATQKTRGGARETLQQARAARRSRATTQTPPPAAPQSTARGGNSSAKTA